MFSYTSCLTVERLHLDRRSRNVHEEDEHAKYHEATENKSTFGTLQVLIPFLCLQRLLQQHAPGSLLPFLFRHGRAAAACELLFPPAEIANGKDSTGWKQDR